MRTITFLSDYGLTDEFVGVVHGVLAGCEVIDITHGIPRHDVLQGAVALADAVPYMPADSVHLAVIDPGVGSDRRSVALQTPSAWLVGPDNGLLIAAAEALGGLTQAFDVARPAPATFHGRDVFAPAALALARDEATGTPLDPTTLVTLEIPAARQDSDGLHATALRVDGFGNVSLSARSWEGDATVNGRRARRAATFSDGAAGELLLIEDSNGRLALVVTEGSAAVELQLHAGQEVVLR